jgi:hypothetical protein
MRACAALLLLVLWMVPSQAQLSGYLSASRGYNSNPLYNYQQTGDRMTEGYLELGYDVPFEASRMRLAYVGGLALFDVLSERTYYEHRLSADYSLFGTKEEREEGEEEGVVMESDSAGSWTQLGAMAGARYDRSAFRDYDNFGIGGFAMFRSGAGSRGFTRRTGEINYREYTYVGELSNLAGSATFSYVWSGGKHFDLGVEIFAGVKHYTQAAYDTAQFAVAGSGSGKSSGQGQGKKSGNGGGLSGKSGKDLLVNAPETNSYQIAPGFTALAKWESGLIKGHALYRINPGTGSRYVGQVAGTSMLTEDLYNDYYSYAGPELGVEFQQGLPLALQLSLTLNGGVRSYGGPALALDGMEIASVRKDVRGEAGLTLSRYVEIAGGVGLGVQVSGELMRNQSNDTYNDYSLHGVSFSVGIGF